ncbi:MAG: hypothetical protein ACREJX_00800, partial [Polyangiaceae bacterium]
AYVEARPDLMDKIESLILAKHSIKRGPQAQAIAPAEPNGDAEKAAKRAPAQNGQAKPEAKPEAKPAN